MALFVTLPQDSKRCLMGFIQAIACDRHLTPEQLQDRIISNCGLDSQGHRGTELRVVSPADAGPNVRGRGQGD